MYLEYCLIKTQSAIQATVALSSGESEFHALNMLVMSGVTGIAVDGTFDVDGKARDLLGLTSARGTTKRSGVERIKHTSTRHLWSQETLRKRLVSGSA